MLLKFWPYLLAAGGILVLFLYWNGRNNEIDDLKIQVANLTAEIVLKDAAYAENERKFKFEINDQNEKINKANAEYEALEQRAEVAVATSNAANAIRLAELNKQLDLLNSIPTPQSCEASIDLLVDIGVQHPWSTRRE